MKGNSFLGAYDRDVTSGAIQKGTLQIPGAACCQSSVLRIHKEETGEIIRVNWALTAYLPSTTANLERAMTLDYFFLPYKNK